MKQERVRIRVRGGFAEELLEVDLWEVEGLQWAESGEIGGCGMVTGRCVSI